MISCKPVTMSFTDTCMCMYLILLDIWLFKWSYSLPMQCLLISKPFTAPCNISTIHVNTLRPRQYVRHFADDIFKCIFLNENVRIPIKISMKFVPKGQINNIPALVQIMAWCRPGNKPLSEPMVVSLMTHICVTRPQWVNSCEILNDIIPWHTATPIIDSRIRR